MHQQQWQEERDEAQTFQNGTFENTNNKSPAVVVSTLERIHRVQQQASFSTSASAPFSIS
jgi:hypothetical protein